MAWLSGCFASKRKPMNRLLLSMLCLFGFQSVNAQQLRAYLFTRAPQLVNYQFKTGSTSYSQGLSMGVGFTKNTGFLELGSFIFEGNSYGYYIFFGSTMKTTELGNTIKLNTNWFGEISHLPSQTEQSDQLWIYTAGACLFPNVQLQRFNLGLPLCLGLAYQEKELYLNTRFILNFSFLLSR